MQSQQFSMARQNLDLPDISKIMRILASPERLGILSLLETHPGISYTEMRWAVTRSLSKQQSGKFAYHVRRLSQGRLITVKTEDFRRGYHLTESGQLCAVLIENLVEPSNFWIKCMNYIPELKRALGKVEDALGSVHAVRLTLAERGPPPPPAMFKKPLSKGEEASLIGRPSDEDDGELRVSPEVVLRSTGYVKRKNMEDS